MQIVDIFSNFISIEMLELDNEPMRKYAIEKAKGQPHQQYFIDDTVDVFKPLHEIVTDRMNKIHTMMGLSDELWQQVDLMWLSVMFNSSITSPHNHPRQMLSAVYYVSAELTSGTLVFMNPNDQHNQVIPSTGRYNIVKEFNRYSSHLWEIPPQTGKLVIFPSWLNHYVMTGDGSERISVAMDSKMFKKGTYIPIV
jgi:uncharacterized protein (TIGR02466 family)